MPSKSRAQQRLMFAAAAKPKMARKLGVPPRVAKEYVTADHKRGAKKLPEKA